MIEALKATFKWWPFLLLLDQQALKSSRRQPGWPVRMFKLFGALQARYPAVI